MMFRTTSTLIVSCCLVATSHAATKVYMAKITAIPGTDSKVLGSVVVFTPEGDTGAADYAVSYGGFLENTPANCKECGVHIHTGMSCKDAAAQGNHLFVDPVLIDPWNNDMVYNSDKNGNAVFSGMAIMGTGKVDGHAFVVHNADGGRIACGLLEEVSTSDFLSSNLKEIGSSGAAGFVTAYQIDESQQICFHGTGTGLVVADNFGGAHIHSGVSCASTTTQEGHYYDKTLKVDPWLTVGYKKTDSEGNAEFVACVEPGVVDYPGKAFVVHNGDATGTRAACGVLGSADQTSDSFALRMPSIVLQTTFFISMCSLALFF